MKEGAGRCEAGRIQRGGGVWGGARRREEAGEGRRPRWGEVERRGREGGSRWGIWRGVGGLVGRELREGWEVGALSVGGWGREGSVGGWRR